MPKITSSAGFALLPILLYSTSVSADSIVTPDTQKTIDDITRISKPRIAPERNITDIMAPETESDKDNPEIYFSADEIEHSQELSLVTAIGNVEIIRNNYTVKADKIIYNQRDDAVTAVGNVVIVHGVVQTIACLRTGGRLVYEVLSVKADSKRVSEVFVLEKHSVFGCGGSVLKAFLVGL